MVIRGIKLDHVKFAKSLDISGTHQSYTQDLGKGVRGASRGGQVEGCTWSLEPGPLTGPHHITQGQDGGP